MIQPEIRSLNRVDENNALSVAGLACSFLDNSGHLHEAIYQDGYAGALMASSLIFASFRKMGVLDNPQFSGSAFIKAMQEVEQEQYSREVMK